MRMGDSGETERNLTCSRYIESWFEHHVWLIFAIQFLMTICVSRNPSAFVAHASVLPVHM